MKNYIKSLYDAHDKLEGIIKKTVLELKPKIEFDDFSIFYQSSDGFVIEYESMNAPLSRCIDIIKSKGFLSYEDYLEERI